jgi:hypothetical protein
MTEELYADSDAGSSDWLNTIKPNPEFCENICCSVA